VKRAFAYIAVLVLAVVIALCAGVWWLVGTTSGARWLLTAIPRTPQFAVSAQSVEGRLLDRLVLSGVRMVAGERDATARRLALTWQPLLLISGSLDIEELSLSGVHIEDRTPVTKKPVDLTWPRIPGVAELFEARIGRLSVTDLTYRRLQRPEVKVSALSAALSWRYTLLLVNNLKAVTPDGLLAGEIVGGLKRPSLRLDLIFAPVKPVAQMDLLSLQARLSPGKAPEQVAGTVSLTGKHGETRLLTVAGGVGIGRTTVKLHRVRVEKKGQPGTVTVDGDVDLSRQEPTVALTVEGKALDLSPQLHRRTDLSGTVRLSGYLERYRGSFALSNRGRGWENISLSGFFAGGKRSASFTRLDGRVLRGTVGGSVEVGWGAPLTVRADLAARGIDPAVVAPAWRGRVNFNARGDLAWARGGQPRWSVAGRLLQSRLKGRELAGEVDAASVGGDILLKRLFLHGEGVDLNAAGRLSRRVDLTVAVDDLSLLVPNGAGSVQGTGWVRYRTGRFAGEMSGRGTGVAVDGVGAGKGVFSAALSDAPGYPLRLDLSLEQLSLGSFRASSAEFSVAGTLPSHAAALHICAPAAEARLAVAGGYRDRAWHGQITDFAGRDEVGPWCLAAPATVGADAGGFTMTPLLVRGVGEEFVSVSAAVGKPSLGGVSLEWGALNLARANSWISGLQLSGASGGAVDVVLLPDRRIDVNGRAQATGTFLADGHRFSVQSALFTVDGDRRGLSLQGEVHMLQGVVQARFTSPDAARLALPREGTLSAQWAHLDLKELAQWFPAGLNVQGQVAGEVNGRLLPGRQLDLKGATALEGGIVHWRKEDQEIDAALQRSEVSFAWQGGFSRGTARAARLALTGRAAGAGSYSKGGRRLDIVHAMVSVDAGSAGTRALVEVTPQGRGVVKGMLSSDRPASFDIPESADFTVTVAGLDPTVIQPWLPGAVNLEGELSGDVTGKLLPGHRLDVKGQTLFAGGVARWRGEQGEMKANLRAAGLTFAWRGDSITGDLTLALSGAGMAKGNFRLPLPARFPTAFDPAGAVSATVTGKLQEQGVLTAFLPGMVQESHADLDMDLRVGGVWRDPRVTGTLNLANGGGYLPPLGIRLTDLTLALRLDQNVVRIDTLRARSGPGEIEAVLEAELEGWQLRRYRGTITGSRFQTFHLPELRMLASPQLAFRGDGKNVELRGEVGIPEMHVLGAPPHQAVSPSRDVVIEGATEEAKAPFPLALDVRVRVALGDKVDVKAEGIDAQLGGGMEIFFTSLEKIRSSGEIKVVKGRYKAYGLDLDIVRGRIYYAGGPIDQPTLDILALRTVGDVKAGVTVGGVLREPIVKLYSEPAMPDVDILAYMVLGHPMGASSTEQGSLLTQAAGVLFTTGQSHSLQEQIKSRLGLSTLGFETASPETTGRMGYKEISVTPTGAPSKTAPVTQSMLTVGKYLTPKLYFSYGRSLFTGSSLFMLRYDISRHWQIESQTGTESGLDVYYKIEFK